MKPSSRSLVIAWAAALAGVLLVPVLCLSLFSRRLPALPEGCDEFGYLSLAEAMSQGETFAGHAARPFDDALLPCLREHGALADYRWLVAPHAYHVEETSHRVINQYPPGTSFLLSLLPLEQRYRLFPVLAGLLLVLPLLLAFAVEGSGLSTLRAGLLLLAGLAFATLKPMTASFEGITSVALSYGALMASGFLLARRPRLGIALLGLSVPVRIANVVFVPFFVAADLLLEARKGREGLARRSAIALAKDLGVVALTTAPYFVYVTMLLGRPWHATYSSIDQSWVSSWDQVRAGLIHYFSLKAPWSIVHVVAIVLGAVLWASQAGRASPEPEGAPALSRKTWALLVLAAAVGNWAFLVLHAVHVTYYLFSSGALLCGALAWLVDESRDRKMVRVAIAVAVVALAVRAGMLVHVPLGSSEAKLAFEQASATWKPLGEYDVLWAGVKGSTFQYVTGKAAFRWGWGTKETRRLALRMLHGLGYREAILLEDGVGREEVVAVLGDARLEFKERAVPGVGTIFEVQPKPRESAIPDGRDACAAAAAR